MKKLLGPALLFAAACVFPLTGARAANSAGPAKARAPAVKPVAIEGGYAVVVSKATNADPEWAKVVATLKQKYNAKVIVYQGDVSDCRADLAKLLPRYACFVATPDEAGRQFVIHVHRLTRQLNDDPYTDVIWGILTGYDAGDALRIASCDKPLVIRKAAAATGIPLDEFDEAVSYSEGEAGVHFEKQAGGKVEKKTGPADSTKALVDLFNSFKPDLFFTSGHASEHNWKIGYSYPNGQFRCKDGVVEGVDLGHHDFPIDSPNPKVYLPLGNCLMGHIIDRNSMACAYMHSAGVDQMTGYVVSTWYGYGGWGIKDYLFGQPGRFSLAQSFFANNQALVHELETRFPKTARANIDEWKIESDPNVIGRIAEKLGYKKWDNTVKDNVGLLWDRDTVAFYGDPAWDARLAPQDCPWNQSLTEKNGVYTFTLTATRDTGWGRPPIAFLPHRVKNPTIISGQEFSPTVGGLFVMISAPKKFEKGKTYTVVFKAGEKPAATAATSGANKGNASSGSAASGSASTASASATKPSEPATAKSQPATAKSQPAAKASQPAQEATSLIDAVNMLPVKYRPGAVKALGAAEKNQGELIKAIVKCPAAHREAMAFLLVNMPPDDLTSLKADFLLDNVDYAYRARQAVPWGKALPDELFFNYVLPYANLNERRDNWRKDFFDRFRSVVKDCKTPGEAALALNKAVFPTLNVRYHPTKRPKPDQSPYESTTAHYASCTGLSIMLADACRALCVPTRTVGTQWTKVGGNHTWVEVWDRQWNFVGAAEPAKLNHTWFFANASQADPTLLIHRIYAASYAQTGKYYPLVWLPYDEDVPGTDVTAFYTRRGTLKLEILDKPGGQPQTVGLHLRHAGDLVGIGKNDSKFQFDVARGEKYVAEITPAGGHTIVRKFTFPLTGDKDVLLYTTNEK